MQLVVVRVTHLPTHAAQGPALSHPFKPSSIPLKPSPILMYPSPPPFVSFVSPHNCPLPHLRYLVSTKPPSPTKKLVWVKKIPLLFNPSPPHNPSKSPPWYATQATSCKITP